MVPLGLGDWPMNDMAGQTVLVRARGLDADADADAVVVAVAVAVAVVVAAVAAGRGGRGTGDANQVRRCMAMGELGTATRAGRGARRGYGDGQEKPGG